MSAIIWIYIAILLFVILIALIMNEISSNELKNSSKIDFGNAIDLTGIPVVTFYNNGNKFNFILDTGADKSVINSIILESLVYTKSNSKYNLSGIEGNPNKVSCVNINLNYRDYLFKEEFQVVNMNKAFNNLKNSTGVEVSGILGSEFFRKYKYVLDFKDLIAYRK